MERIYGLLNPKMERVSTQTSAVQEGGVIALECNEKLEYNQGGICDVKLVGLCVRRRREIIFIIIFFSKKYMKKL